VVGARLTIEASDGQDRAPSRPRTGRCLSAKDPKHERHAELSEWIGDDFDPNAFDVDEHAEALAALAKSWSRKPAAKRARPA
jgi:hypothetical protein